MTNPEKKFEVGVPEDGVWGNPNPSNKDVVSTDAVGAFTYEDNDQPTVYSSPVLVPKPTISERLSQLWQIPVVRNTAIGFTSITGAAGLLWAGSEFIDSLSTEVPNAVVVGFDYVETTRVDSYNWVLQSGEYGPSQGAIVRDLNSEIDTRCVAMDPGFFDIGMSDPNCWIGCPLMGDDQICVEEEYVNYKWLELQLVDTLFCAPPAMPSNVHLLEPRSVDSCDNYASRNAADIEITELSPRYLIFVDRDGSGKTYSPDYIEVDFKKVAGLLPGDVVTARYGDITGGLKEIRINVGK